MTFPPDMAARYGLHPLLQGFPADAPVLDMTKGPPGPAPGPYSVGRYDEVRPGVYTAPQFAGRSLHVGLDLGAPAGSAVHAVADGRIHAVGVRPYPGDYGGVLIVAHPFPEGDLWMLLGHLAPAVADTWTPGDPVRRGEVLGHLGTPEENGGWPPHVHVQLALEPPGEADLPGVVPVEERAEALRRYPDPRILLGSLTRW